MLGLGCSRGDDAATPAPQVQPPAQATPAPQATPEIAVPAAEAMPESDLPWAAVISEGAVVACRDGDTFMDGDKCPDKVFAVRIEWDVTDKPVSLTTGETMLTANYDDDPCPHYRLLADQPSDITQLGRIGKNLAPDDPEIKAWLDPLLQGGALKVVRLRALDVDGDGRDEQFYELDTHPDVAFVDGPAKMVSVIGVRSVSADGTASVTELYRDEGELAAGVTSEFGYGKGSIYGWVDIDGDSALEVVITGGKIQDMRYELHTIAGGGAAKLAQLACKWGDVPD
jgi:hypothetical protein